MKKLLLILLLASVQAFSQSATEKANTALEKAKTYLADDACSTTGMAWVDKALSYDPSNAQAKTFVSNCQQHKYNKAMSTLATNPQDKAALKTIEALTVQEQFSNEQAHYLIASGYANNGRFNNATKKHINKALSFNPDNIEYRWLRVRCNMLSSSSTDDLKLAIDDLLFIKNNGENTAQTNESLGVAYKQLSHQIKRYEDFDKEEVLKLYNMALNSYKTASGMSTDYESKLKFDISTLEADIEKLKQQAN